MVCYRVVEAFRGDLKSNNLEFLYKMDNLKMYAVKLSRALTADEMDDYIAKLEKLL